VAMVAGYLGLTQSVIKSVLAIASFTTGAVLGLFFLGVLTRHVTQKAALPALWGGLALLIVIAFGTPLTWPWYAVVGSVATFLFGLVVQCFLLPQEKATP
jgi:solute:Na+ symporter, SSS family